MIKAIFNQTIAWQVENLTRIKLDHNKLKKKVSSTEILDLLRLQNKEDLLLITCFRKLVALKVK